jgi:putative transcriptional regulator
MSMKILRDLKESTKLLILLEITTARHTKLKTIAEKLGITVQGVSEYLKHMVNEGLVAQLKGEYRATTKGVELLHQNFIDIKGFVDESMKKLDIVNLCTAIAGRDLKKDQRVGLVMENGILTAYPDRKTGSTGTAISDVRKGEDVGIRDLEGIVSLKPGRLWIIELPGIESGGSRGMNLKNVRALFSKSSHDRIAALDTSAVALARKLGMKPSIEFGATEACIEALQKGLNVLAFGSEEEVNRLMTRVNEANAESPNKIRFKVLSSSSRLQ